MMQSTTPSWFTLILTQLPMILTSLGTLLVAIAGFRKLAVGQENAAVTATQVKDTLVETHHTTEKKIDAIHTLVNSEHSVSLRLSANYAARIAALTKDPGDIKAAEDSRRAADEHDAQQQAVNQNAQTPATPGDRPDASF